MSAPLGRLLIVEDDPFLLEQLTWALKGKFAVSGARDASQGKALCESEPDIYLFDLRLPPSNQVREGLELLKHVRRRDPEATVVMMSGEGERAHALEAVALGAFDFFQKPIDTAELMLFLNRALERRRLVVENRELRREAGAAAAFGAASASPLLGQSAAMRRLRKEIEKVAGSDASVLLQGESGTGKELVARAIHAASPRRDRAFVAVNASALPESLAESELFGHEKGSFTGAIASRPGRFELAQGGTLFLDEIGTLSAGVQSKLLRAIESREIERVGGQRSIPVDFRLVSATNEDLEARIAGGTFREDLYYRINTIPIAIAPLREREGDIPLLAQHFLERVCERERLPTKRFAPSALARLEGHSWRGNVRELSHAVELAVLFSEGAEIGEDDLPRSLRGVRSARASAPKSYAAAVEEFERRLLTDAIAAAGGVKAEAARRLGLDANQIKYLCRKFGL